ncbi:hypothetical protein D3C73_599340 [compost metagenome]
MEFKDADLTSVAWLSICDRSGIGLYDSLDDSGDSIVSGFRAGGHSITYRCCRRWCLIRKNTAAQRYHAPARG